LNKKRSTTIQDPSANHSRPARCCLTRRSTWHRHQLAGYRHVVATLWPVRDAVATAFTRDFYQVVNE
jgi:hypothetical protein